MPEVQGTTETSSQRGNSVDVRTTGSQEHRAVRGQRLLAIGLQLLGAVLVASSVIVGVFVSHAGATALSNGTVGDRNVGRHGGDEPTCPCTRSSR